MFDSAGAAFSFAGSASSGIVREGAGLVFGMTNSIETYQ